jgi:hypothetical protein
VTIVLMGTTHEVQETDYQGTQEFKKVLLYLCEQFPISVIMEEWTETKGDTVGKRPTSERRLEWVSVGTPSRCPFAVRPVRHPTTMRINIPQCWYKDRI